MIFIDAMKPPIFSRVYSSDKDDGIHVPMLFVLGDLCGVNRVLIDKNIALDVKLRPEQQLVAITGWRQVCAANYLNEPRVRSIWTTLSEIEWNTTQTLDHRHMTWNLHSIWFCHPALMRDDRQSYDRSNILKPMLRQTLDASLNEHQTSSMIHWYFVQTWWQRLHQW